MPQLVVTPTKEFAFTVDIKMEEKQSSTLWLGEIKRKDGVNQFSYLVKAENTEEDRPY